MWHSRSASRRLLPAAFLSHLCHHLSEHPLWDDADFTWLSGLVAALCLARYLDIDITVFEGASRLAEVGAGIGFLPSKCKSSAKLEIFERLAEEEEDTTFICRMSDQDGGHHFEYHTSERCLQFQTHRVGSETVLVARLKKVDRDNVTSLLDEPCSRAPDSSSLPHNPLSSTNFLNAPFPYAFAFPFRPRSSYDHPISLRFEDVTVATCDVLIDANGLQSRACVVMMERMVSEAVGQADETGQADVDALAAAAQPVWSGFVAYRVLISAGKKLRERAPQHSLLSNPMLYFGKNACIVGYSIQNGACLNVIFFTFDPTQEHGVHPGEWMRKAAKADWWAPSRAMVDVNGALRWAVHTTKPPGLPTFVHGRTARLGDAAHSKTPFQGSGAGQAVEDAWLLAHLLGDPTVTRDTIPEALRVYDAARRHVAQDVQERSRVNGHLLALNYRGIDCDALQGEAERAALIQLGEQMQRDWEWAWSTSTDGMVHDSLEALRKAVL
ncbi:hypothetical protein FB107DRAFT_294162 [Schizophyllum commune]